MLPLQNRDAHLLHVEKTMNCMTFYDFNNFMVLGPRPLGTMGPSSCCDFFEIYFMVWDLSRSVPGVFRSPGNSVINLFHFIFNSTCSFNKKILLKFDWYP